MEPQPVHERTVPLCVLGFLGATPTACVRTYSSLIHGVGFNLALVTTC